MSKQSRSGKAESGGGYTSNKLRRVGVKAAPRTTNVIDPHAPDFLGQSTSFKKPPFVKSAAKEVVPMGNSLVNNVGAGGPGKGRTVYPCGYQDQHGSVAKGERGIVGDADHGKRQILGPPANTGAVQRRGQQRDE
jgi:hypothetical protein